MTTQDQRFAWPGWRGPFVHYGGLGPSFESRFDYVVIDVETTGFDPADGARVLEVSAVRTDCSGSILDSFTTLLNPGVQDTGAEHIHGITMEMIANAPTFGDVFGHLVPLLNNAVFVAHHAKFDETFIAAEAKRAGISLSTMPGLCTYWLSRQCQLDVPNHKLVTLAEYFGIDTGTSHSAYDDALVVAQMLPMLSELAGSIEHYAQPQTQTEWPGLAQAATR